MNPEVETELASTAGRDDASIFVWRSEFLWFSSIQSAVHNHVTLKLNPIAKPFPSFVQLAPSVFHCGDPKKTCVTSLTESQRKDVLEALAIRWQMKEERDFKSATHDWVAEQLQQAPDRASLGRATWSVPLLSSPC